MAITGNKSSIQVISEKKLYTGLCNVKVVAINPDVKELGKLFGKEPEKEPVYITEVDGVKKVRIDFFLKTINPEIVTKLAIFVGPENVWNTAKDKQEYMDDFGRSSYSASAETLPEWFDKSSARIAKQGESMLHDFVKKWANVAGDAKCKLDTFEKIAKGDIKELKDILKTYPDNEVRVLLGVRDGKYQDVYNRVFEYPYKQSPNNFIKALENPRSTFKSDYQGSLELKIYIPKLNTSGELAVVKNTDW